MSNTPTLDQLKRAVTISEQIATLEAELAAVFSGSPVAPKVLAKASPAKKADGRTGKKSPETIAKMKAAQQARWAAKKAPASAPATKAPAPVKKAGMSAAHKAKLAKAAKARWARIKAGKEASPFGK